MNPIGEKQVMKAILFLFALALVPVVACADFSCPDGTHMACLDEGDSVCPATARCVDADAVCFDARACESSRGFICGSEFDAIMGDYEKAVNQYNQLISENVDLRKRSLDQKNCILNASTLTDARKCAG